MNETSERGVDAPNHVILQLVDESGKALENEARFRGEKDYATKSTPVLDITWNDFRARYQISCGLYVGWMRNAIMRVLIESLLYQVDICKLLLRLRIIKP